MPFRSAPVAVALSLVATALVNPARAVESASELNIEALNLYSSSSRLDQVTSINQFSDVKPTDWAYQALNNLIERYGCVAGYPNGSFKGGQAMTRYEAAALLNACLDRISEVTDELKRLMKEFEKELALLKGRVDGLEARVGELEATQFSTTTRLRADTRWVIGGLDYSGNTTRYPAYTNSSLPAYEAIPGKLSLPGYTPLRNAVTFNYDVRLNFDTSFSGKDLLRTQLRAGNFAQSGFSSQNPVTPLANLDAAFEEGCGKGADCGDVVAINRLYYRFPLASSLTVVAGPRVRQDDLLPVWPSVYTADRILKIFQYAGAPGTYSQVLGAGGGAWWRQAGRNNGWSFGVAYVAANGDNANPSQGGIATEGSAGTGTLQLAYTGRNWNLTGAYTRSTAGVTYPGTPLAVDIQPRRGLNNGFTNSFALSGYWQPFNSGWLPSISAGWGTNRITYTGVDTLVPAGDRGYKGASESWSVGLVWNDVLMAGNALGFAIGEPTHTTNPDGDTVCVTWFPPACSAGGKGNANFHEPKDGNIALEAYYKMQVTDNISVTPSLFWLSRRRGQYTFNYGPGTNDRGTFSSMGYLVQTTFRF